MEARSANDDELELKRIEAVLLEALNSLHSLRRKLSSKGTASPAEPDWVSCLVAAERLLVSESTVWRYANRYGANWPQPGTRLVDFNRLRKLRPPRRAPPSNPSNPSPPGDKSRRS